MAIGHDASLCFIICNSTDKKICFVVKPLSNDITSTKTIYDFDLESHKSYLIHEQFINYNQYELGKLGDKVLREIEIVCDGILISTIQLICFKFCPDPFYRLKENTDNPLGFILQKKRIKGSGPSTVEIVKKKK